MVNRPLHFNTYILIESKFSDDEQLTILNEVKHPKNKKTLNLILIIIAWNIVAAFIESALIGGGIFFSILKGVNWIYFVPEFIFIIINFSSKAIFTSRYLKNYISFKHTIIACIPSIGPFVLLGILLHNNRLLIRAFKNYVVYRKRHHINSLMLRIKNIFGY